MASVGTLLSVCAVAVLFSFAAHAHDDVEEHDECPYTDTTCVPYIAPMQVDVEREVAYVETTGKATLQTIVSRLPSQTAATAPPGQRQCPHCSFLTEAECVEVATTCPEDFLTNVKCATIKTCEVACALTPAGLGKLDSMKSVTFRLRDPRPGDVPFGQTTKATGSCRLEHATDFARLRHYEFTINSPCDEHNPRHGMPWHSIKTAGCTAAAGLAPEPRDLRDYVTVRLKVNAATSGRRRRPARPWGLAHFVLLCFVSLLLPLAWQMLLEALEPETLPVTPT